MTVTRVRMITARESGVGTSGTHDQTVCAHDSLTGETLCQHLLREVGDFVLQLLENVRKGDVRRPCWTQSGVFTEVAS